MPDLTPDEAERCPHCNAILQDPPRCCMAMLTEWEEETERSLQDRYDEDDEWSFDEFF